MPDATIGRSSKRIGRPALQDLNDLYLFVLVVDKGSFTAASRAAGLTTSRISRRIADLEVRLGVRLLHRTTRKLTLTAIGEMYYQHCQAMVSEAEAASEVVEQIQASPPATWRPPASRESYPRPGGFQRSHSVSSAWKAGPPRSA